MRTRSELIEYVGMKLRLFYASGSHGGEEILNELEHLVRALKGDTVDIYLYMFSKSEDVIGIDAVEEAIFYGAVIRLNKRVETRG